MSIRVAIVEDDRSVRENLAVLIDAAPGFACVAACTSAEEALKRLPQTAPDVVLMDINLPGRSGIDCVARLRPVLRHTHVIMLTVEEDSRSSNSRRARRKSCACSRGGCVRKKSPTSPRSAWER